MLTVSSTKIHDFSSKITHKRPEDATFKPRCGSCGAFRFHEDARTGVAGGSPRCSERLHARTELTDASSVESPRTTNNAPSGRFSIAKVRLKSDLFSFSDPPRTHPTFSARKKSRNNSREEERRIGVVAGLKEKRRTPKRAHAHELGRRQGMCGSRPTPDQEESAPGIVRWPEPLFSKVIMSAPDGTARSKDEKACPSASPVRILGGSSCTLFPGGLK